MTLNTAVCSLPVHQRPSVCLAAPAEAGQGAGTPHPEKTGLDKMRDDRMVLAKGAGPGIWNRWVSHVEGHRIFWSRVRRDYLA